jgi:SOS-response transcriptional repressor LexA
MNMWLNEEKIYSRLKHLGLSKAEASRRVSQIISGGHDHTVLRRVLSGETRNPRFDTLRAIAKVLECDLSDLTDVIDCVASTPESRLGSDASMVPIIGRVESRRFYTVEIAGRDESQSIPAPRHHRFPNARHFAYEVSGDSMNKLNILNGDFVICVAWDDTGYKLADGLIVVVEQSRNSGQVFERTLRQAKRRVSDFALVARSTNSAHQEISYQAEAEDRGSEVCLIGLVYHLSRPINVMF